jgi:glucosamine kinase
MPMSTILIADSGSTKAEWCLLSGKTKKTILTQGLSPYFVTGAQITEILQKQVLPKIKNNLPDEIYFYGTGCANTKNAKLVKNAIEKAFANAKVTVHHDLFGAAKALCGTKKGIACILGTGCNSCYYNGKKIIANSPGLGYVLGDEGSGAYLGKKVLQYFLYKTFDAELSAAFQEKYNISKEDILEQVYKKPLANRYLASFAIFLSEHRGHYMIENIIEDALNDFFYTHLCKYKESWSYPISFTGSVAFAFKDVIKDLCNSYQFQLGKIIKKPMDGLIQFHKS